MDATYHNFSYTALSTPRLCLFRHGQSLGNVDEAMSQVRSLQDTEDKSEAIIRAKV